ncbi:MULTISPECIES: DUF3035 domain-containing protein [Novosphingobium]|uniref:Lipoprotein n=1 Tax=Novosphingobium sediminicola TaxID=563162 RepID=A0A7W6CFJ8_9SPHN|nr:MULTISPECIES: DUF3035 domain-containing protein [Novosphingobium]MBB3954525.1 hypothetical protein [Novosphingobium sediminicola]MBN9142729.1 DUF3035 domain-containing protein [Novosphingobium sp.]MDR6705813.1 hypothetical protein [Novosphingobium sp. 1748]NKJ00129.1 hypothetical protein [Novosphingobium sp. SG707]NOW45424.1 hypothetical protein [Novosphingobium sp. SG751A]
MRKISAILLAGTTCLMLSGCGAGGLFNRVRPDEFAVQRQTPLFAPPDFALTPPQPGAPRPNTRPGQVETTEAMFGPAPQRSGVENAAVAKMGTGDASIRSTVADPKTATANKGDVTRTIVAAPEGDGREAQAKTPPRQ